MAVLRIAVGRVVIDDEDAYRTMTGSISSEIRSDHTYSLILARSWRGLKGFAT